MAEFLFSVAAIVLTGLALGLGTLLGRGPLERRCARSSNGARCRAARHCDLAREPGGVAQTSPKERR